MPVVQVVMVPVRMRVPVRKMGLGSPTWCPSPMTQMIPAAQSPPLRHLAQVQVQVQVRMQVRVLV